MTTVAQQLIRLVPPTPPRLLAQIAERTRQTRAASREIVRLWRKDIDTEFGREEWHPQSGSPRAWKPTKDFGNRPASRKTLQGSGALRRAWTGEGAGAIERYSDRGAEFGVAGTLFPYARVHRGGTGRVTAAMSRRPEIIAVTPRMRVFLGVVRGVWLRKDTTVIHIPRRPHAGVTPRIRTEATAVMARYVLTGSAKLRLGAA